MVYVVEYLFLFCTVPLLWYWVCSLFYRFDSFFHILTCVLSIDYTEGRLLTFTYIAISTVCPHYRFMKLFTLLLSYIFSNIDNMEPIILVQLCTCSYYECENQYERIDIIKCLYWSLSKCNKDIENYVWTSPTIC